MTLHASARTHAGRVRPLNEDAAVCRPERGLFAVIDGMGGEEAGEVAAAIAAAALAEVPDQRRLPSETVLAAAFKEARARILKHGDEEPAHRNMGAVATAIRFEDNGRAVGLAHVGDSRAWLVGARGIRQLTHDHAEPAGDGGKPRVARDLGRREMSDDWVETGRAAVSPGDLLVLATDGLHDAVPEAELAETLTRLRREDLDTDAMSARLVALALARGGPDNVTVIVVRVGPFRRGGVGRRRLGLAVSAAVFLVMSGQVGVAMWGKMEHPRVPLPNDVTAALAIDADDVPVVAGQVTAVAAGGELRLRGARVHGPEWTIQVADGGRVVLDRSVVAVDGGFTVLLTGTAEIVVEDTRVDAATVRIVGVEQSRVALRHATLRASAADGPSLEGPFTRAEDDARLLGVPPAESPPAPPAEPGP